MRNTLSVIALSIVAGSTLGFQVAKNGPANPDANGTRPIAAVDSVFIEDMTWMEVRDAMQAGADTVIVATGGIEQNGPYLVAGKHNVVLRAMTDAIARNLGNALVAPIVGFVPEGDIDPPTAHMKYPSTVSVTEDTYRRLLTDICSCYHTHGFKHIILLGDSGGNVDGMKAVSSDLNAQWKESSSRIHFIPEYYNYDDVEKWLDEQGVKQVDEGLHDDFAISAIMLTVDPLSVRMQQRLAAGKFKINGIELAPVEQTIAWGKKIIKYRADVTVRAIRAAMKANL